MTDTASRRRMLHRLLTGRSAASQAELVRLLADAGFPVTQATVSRDLAALGAAKVVAATAARSTARSPPRLGTRAGRAGSRHLRPLDHGEREPCRHQDPPRRCPRGGRLDRRRSAPGVIGTVAGDDTVLVVAADGVSGHTLAADLERSGAGR